jgi:hypothetical protein
MGIDLGSIALDEAHTVVKFGGQEAKVKYRPSVLTTRRLEQIQAEIEAENSSAFLAFLPEAIIEWDVTKEGEMFPLSEDALKDLPLVFVRAVYLAILSDAGQGEAPKPSEDG